MLRNIAAVIVGYLIFAISAALFFQISGRDPHTAVSATFMVVSILYGILFAALAGFVAVRMSASHSLAQAIIVGVLISVGALVSLLAQPGAGARWSQLSALLLMAPAAIVGGTIGGRVSKRRA